MNLMDHLIWIDFGRAIGASSDNKHLTHSTGTSPATHATLTTASGMPEQVSWLLDLVDPGRPFRCA
jgi:hypothetical protein